jgi:hypothetical protein
MTSAGQRDHLGVRGRARRADAVGVALNKLAEAAGSRLFIAPDLAELIAAKRLGEILEMLGGEAGERRGQIIAQRHPLLVIILQREHAFIGALFIGQEFAQHVGVFKSRRLQRLKAPALIDLARGGNERARRATRRRRGLRSRAGGGLWA